MQQQQRHLVRDCVRRAEPLAAKPGDTVRAAAKRMAEQACSSILVCEGGRLLGIFTERDLLARVVAESRDPDKTRLEEVMSADLDTIGPDEPVVEAIRRMDEFSYRHLPVVEGGKVLGVVSWRDLPFEDRAQAQPELDQRHDLAERIW
jgi:CBS domain-containing protein